MTRQAPRRKTLSLSLWADGETIPGFNSDETKGECIFIESHCNDMNRDKKNKKGDQ